MKTTKAILFARVSTKEQAEEGYSLASQVNLLKDYAKRKGIKIVKKFEVPESARGVQKRKIFKEMMDFLDNNPEVKTILCEKVDRFTRNSRDAVLADDWLQKDELREIHFVKQSLIAHKNASANEKLQWDFHIMIAKNFSNNLSEEVKKGNAEKIRQGIYPGNMKRGYKTIGEKGHKLWIIDESQASEAPFIKKAFELFDTGVYTTKTIGQKMFKEGWKTKSGKPIGKSTMHKLLSDCFYCGEFVWNDKHYTHQNNKNGIKHPEIISSELFYRVQDRLKRNVAGKYRSHNFLFKGMITCGECGRTITGEVQKGHHYYKCTKYETNCTQSRYVREEDLEKQIIAHLDKIKVKNQRMANWIRKALKEHYKIESDYHKKAIASLNSQYTQIQQRIDTLYEDKLDSNITEEMYKRKYAEYTQKLDDIETAREKHQSNKISYFELGVNIFELAQQGKALYKKKKSPDDKRALIGIVFSNLTLKDGKLVPTYAPAFDLIAQDGKKENWLPG